MKGLKSFFEVTPPLCRGIMRFPYGPDNETIFSGTCDDLITNVEYLRKHPVQPIGKGQLTLCLDRRCVKIEASLNETAALCNQQSIEKLLG